jgi:hypothetical protein
VDTAAVLGVQQVRPPFLDDVRGSAWIEARHAAASHARRDYSSANGSEACRCSGVRRSGCNRSRKNDAHRSTSLTRLPDEVEEDEADDADRVVWHVLLT